MRLCYCFILLVMAATGDATATVTGGTAAVATGNNPGQGLGDTATAAQLLALITNLTNEVNSLRQERAGNNIAPVQAPPGQAAATIDNAFAVCGLSQDDMESLKDQHEIAELERLTSWKDQDTFRTFLHNAARQTGAIRLQLGGYKVNALVALHFWVQDRSFRQLPLDPELFTKEALKESMLELNKSIPSNQSKAEAVKFSTKGDYYNWKSDFINRLGQTRSHYGNRYNLRYVIRPDWTPGEPVPEGFEEKDYDFPLTGTVFKDDNSEVASLLGSDVIGNNEISHIRKALAAKKRARGNDATHAGPGGNRNYQEQNS